MEMKATKRRVGDVASVAVRVDVAHTVGDDLLATEIRQAEYHHIAHGHIVNVRAK